MNRFDPLAGAPAAAAPKPTGSLARQILAMPDETIMALSAVSNPKRVEKIRAEFAAWATTANISADGREAWLRAWRDFAGSPHSLSRPAILTAPQTDLEALAAL